MLSPLCHSFPWNGNRFLKPGIQKASEKPWFFNGYRESENRVGLENRAGTWASCIGTCPLFTHANHTMHEIEESNFESHAWAHTWASMVCMYVWKVFNTIYANIVLGLVRCILGGSIKPLSYRKKEIKSLYEVECCQILSNYLDFNRVIWGLSPHVLHGPQFTDASNNLKVSF